MQLCIAKKFQENVVVCCYVQTCSTCIRSPYNFKKMLYGFYLIFHPALPLAYDVFSKFFNLTYCKSNPNCQIQKQTALENLWLAAQGMENDSIKHMKEYLFGSCPS